MSCWVLPSVAADLWGVSLDAVLEQVRAGAVASKIDEGSLVVDVGPLAPRPAPADRPAAPVPSSRRRRGRGGPRGGRGPPPPPPPPPARPRPIGRRRPPPPPAAGGGGPAGSRHERPTVAAPRSLMPRVPSRRRRPPTRPPSQLPSWMRW